METRRGGGPVESHFRWLESDEEVESVEFRVRDRCR